MTNPSPADSPSADALLGRRVHHLMWDRKLTQTALGQQVGIEQSLLAKKLRGNRGWNLAEVQRVAFALDTTVAYLVGETDDAARPHPTSGPRPPAFIGGGTSFLFRRRPERDSNAQPTGYLQRFSPLGVVAA